MSYVRHWRHPQWYGATLLRQLSFYSMYLALISSQHRLKINKYINRYIRFFFKHHHRVYSNVININYYITL